MSKAQHQAAGLLLALFFALAAGWASAAAAGVGANAPQKTLSAFRSDDDLLRFLKRVRKAQRSRYAAQPPPPSPAPADGAAPAQATTDKSAAGESITNTQEAGVDEGGIVKMRGDTLVILRRGRLFTVSTRQGDLRPIDSIDAFPPGSDARGDWYDEMLIAGDRVIVIGYSYSRGGTEINRFRIDNAGRLQFEDAYHLRSNDYYSSRNYASRLIGNQLIVYSPLYLPYEVSDNFDEWMPALRRWNGESGGSKAGFRRIASAREIYLPRTGREPEEGGIDALHTVSNCDLTAPVMRCRATSVLGPAGRTFYVSANAVYVWVTQWNRTAEARGPSSLLYRLPLDGRAPSAIGVRGGPVDQFSFREDWNDGMLNVLVRGEGGGDAMWSAEFSAGAVALLRLPLNMFGDGADDAGRSYYRRLPTPGTNSYAFQNRFVGDYVLYGTGTSWGRPQGRASVLVVAAVRGGGVSQIPLEHGVDRIEAMGRDAVVVGSDAKALHFSAVELTSGRRPVLGDRYTLESAAQGETRSHAFFFKPEPRMDRNDQTAGVLGLPVARAGRPGHRQLVEGSATMIFLRRANRVFAPLGEIAAHEDGIVDDGCKASCVDWYGNARPIFLRERTFALMGYEIVEGELTQTSIRETRRINFAPSRW